MLHAVCSLLPAACCLLPVTCCLLPVALASATVLVAWEVAVVDGCRPGCVGFSTTPSLVLSANFMQVMNVVAGETLTFNAVFTLPEGLYSSASFAIDFGSWMFDPTTVVVHSISASAKVNSSCGPIPSLPSTLGLAFQPNSASPSKLLVPLCNMWNTGKNHAVNEVRVPTRIAVVAMAVD